MYTYVYMYIMFVYLHTHTLIYIYVCVYYTSAWVSAIRARVCVFRSV